MKKWEHPEIFKIYKRWLSAMPILNKNLIISGENRYVIFITEKKIENIPNYISSIFKNKNNIIISTIKRSYILDNNITSIVFMNKDDFLKNGILSDILEYKIEELK